MLVVNSYGAIADAITPAKSRGSFKGCSLNRKFGYTTKSPSYLSPYKRFELIFLVII